MDLRLVLVLFSIVLHENAAQECPKLVGDVLENLSGGLNGTWMNLMMNKIFPCDGMVTGWSYYRLEGHDSFYLGVWRHDTDNKYTLIGQTRVDGAEAVDGINTINLPDSAGNNQIVVKAGDFIGIHFGIDDMKCPVANQIYSRKTYPLDEPSFVLSAKVYDPLSNVVYDFGKTDKQFLRKYSIQAQVEPDALATYKGREEVECDARIVPVTKSFKKLGIITTHGNWANIQIDNTFPCDGEVTSWKYARGEGRDETAFAAVWRKIDKKKNTMLYKLVFKTQLDGTSEVTLTQAVKVKKGDCIGVHYEDSVSKLGSIINASPWHADQGKIDAALMYMTINVELFDGGIKDENDFSPESIVPRLLFLKAVFKADAIA